MSNKNLITQEESTELTLRKATDIINRTNKILKNSKKELVANPDIMIIDGKMWQKETVEKEMTWDEAMEYAKNLRLGGYDDWRLPTIDELGEIIENCGAIKTNRKNKEFYNLIDKNKDNKFYQSCYKERGFSKFFYWSATSNIIETNNRRSTWVADFKLGYISNHPFERDSNYVRCVRG